MSGACKGRTLAHMPLRGVLEWSSIVIRNRRPLTTGASLQDGTPRLSPQFATSRPTASNSFNTPDRERRNSSSGGPPKKSGYTSIMEQLIKSDDGKGSSNNNSGASDGIRAKRPLFGSGGPLLDMKHLTETLRSNQAAATAAAASAAAAAGAGGLPEFIEEPFHLHVKSTKHNTHITVTRPNRNAIISVSCGNIGHRKSRRGTFDAAHQLGMHVFSQLRTDQWDRRIGRLEVIFRGFGNGREAITKMLLGTEGERYREKIIRVTDATRLKFGGSRSPKPRRL